MLKLVFGGDIQTYYNAPLHYNRWGSGSTSTTVFKPHDYFTISFFQPEGSSQPGHSADMNGSLSSKFDKISIEFQFPVR